jgi:hypothetical protein
MALNRGRLPEKRCRLHEHALAIGGPDRPRSVDKSAHLEEPRAIRIDRNRVRVSNAGRDGYPDREGDDESASQDCGNASAAS